MADDRAEGEPASDVEALRHDLADAREEIFATNEVLAAMGRSASDLNLVLGTIVESARRLSGADGSLLFLRDGPVFRLVRSSGLSGDFVEHMEAHPILRDNDSLTGRIAHVRLTLQIKDVLADPAYGLLDAQRLGGYRTVLGAPMLLDGDVIGVLQVWRTEVNEFDDRAVALLSSFAAAAAIAARNLELVRTLEARTEELAGKVDQLEALGEIGDAVSSSLDLDQVLSTIVKNAVELSGTDGGSLMEFDDTQQLFFVRTAYGTSDEVVERLRNTRISLEGTLVGRSALENRSLQVASMSGQLDPHLQVLHDDGWRSLLATPMLREGGIVGVLVVRRRRAGDFPDEICEVLQTFASQSCLAVLNARLFRELERKSAELEVASRHKSEFLASMSHELRTPLNAVIGFSEVLLDRMFGEINPRQEEYLRDIWNSGKHLLQLLSEILDLSKVEAGRMELENAPFSVREALEHGVSMIRERAARRSLHVTLDVDPSVGVIDADELRFNQIVLNLLSNAVKFASERGDVKVGATATGDDLVVTVSDTGPGVPPDDRERIFESFQQGRRGVSTQEGTGLGLTLCRRIVGLMGGQIWLESEVGVGSTFAFTIPMRSSASERATAARTDVLESPTVLVIDDHRPSADLLTAYLETAGFDVELASDGRSGLAMARARGREAIVLDIRLPGMDGWRVLEELKSDPVTTDVPVIIVSIVDERTRGLSLGASDHLVKPVSREELLASLARAGVIVESNGAVTDGSGR